MSGKAHRQTTQNDESQRQLARTLLRTHCARESRARVLQGALRACACAWHARCCSLRRTSGLHQMNRTGAALGGNAHVVTSNFRSGPKGTGFVRCLVHLSVHLALECYLLRTGRVRVGMTVSCCSLRRTSGLHQMNRTGAVSARDAL